MKILYVFSAGPYSNARGQEGLDAMLMGANFDLEVAALFLHDGVFQLKSGQDSNGSELKEFTKTYMALSDFGVDDIYVHDQSLVARGLGQDKLMINTKMLDGKAISDLIKQHDRVFVF